MEKSSPFPTPRSNFIAFYFNDLLINRNHLLYFLDLFQITVHFMLGFREICSVTAALPLVTLFMCFVGAVVFQFDEVHETHCRVKISTTFLFRIYF